MESEYSQVSLGDVARVRSGFAFKSRDWTTAGIPVVKIANVKDGELAMEGCSFVTQQVADEAAEWRLRRGDILIAMTGYIGDVARVRDDRPRLLNQRVGRFDNLDSALLSDDFLFYVLRAPEIRQAIAGLGYGSAQPNVSPKLIHGVQIPLPPINEQKAIAAVLSSLDDKVEQNRRTGRALEKLARAIFRAWFVDFEPVHAKAAGATSFPSMPQDVFNGLPTRLIDSPLGPVPEGWKVETVADLCDSITSGGTPSRKNPLYWSGGTIDWFKTGELTDGPLLTSAERITQEALENSACKLWDAGTVLFALYASPTVGRLGVLTRPGTSNQAAAGLRAKPEIGTPFLMHSLFVAREELQRIAVGAAQQNINQGVLKSHRLLVPSAALTRAFSAVIGTLFKLQTCSMSESSKLAELRDYLLPKLLSGQVRVRDAEKWADDPAAFDFADHESDAAPTSVSVQCDLTGPSGSRDRRRDDDEEQASSGGIAVAEADDGTSPFTDRLTVPIESWSTEEVMAAFRQAARNRGAMTREELLKRVAQRLGYQRLGSAIRERLKNHLRAALRRHIIAADGPEMVVAETTTMSDYEIDELIDVLRSVMRKGQALQREEVMRAVASHLGFTRLIDSVQAPIKSAINAGIRRGILQYDRNTLWRVA